MNKKAVFFDVDGTLIDYMLGMRDVLDSTKDAIKKIEKDGNLAVLATGRPKSFLNDEIINLGFDAYITSNGAYIEMDNKIIYNKTIDRETLKKAVGLFRKENLEFILEGQRYSFFTDLATEKMKRFIKLFSLPEKYLTDKWDVNEVLTNKMVVMVNNQAQLKLCMDNLQDTFSFMNHPGQMSYDLFFNDCTKADGIKKFVEHLKLDINNTYAIGDGINDIEMLQTVRYGIAMGNANEKLKKVACYVTNDVQSHGIYNGLKELQVI